MLVDGGRFSSIHEHTNKYCKGYGPCVGHRPTCPYWATHDRFARIHLRYSPLALLLGQTWFVLVLLRCRGLKYSFKNQTQRSCVNEFESGLFSDGTRRYGVPAPFSKSRKKELFLMYSITDLNYFRLVNTGTYYLVPSEYRHLFLKKKALVWVKCVVVVDLCIMHISLCYTVSDSIT